VVICGFGAKGQVLANMLESPVASSSTTVGYIAFDTDVGRVRSSRTAGFNVVYGDATSPSVVKAAGGG
jgi:voltage-gated potassium channel Kch